MIKMKWDKFFDEKIKILARGERILDAGGGRPFNKQLAKYQSLFKGKEVVVTDKNVEPEYKDSVIEADIHELPFEDESFDGFICKSVLEHVEDPVKAVSELYRVLKTGGCGLVYVPFLFPYHAEKGVYKDFWRFSEDGVRYLFRNFSSIEIEKVRGFFETVIYFIPFFRKILIWPARLLDKFFSSKNQVSGFTFFVRK
ncbi:MAG: class I SAM-dependent methyltransferase [Candidatus Marinimicrobia bacterium]|nr:class I SAM-dependent methyltransferase [Candidatus Neomarinimicrobiota bacterium]